MGCGCSRHHHGVCKPGAVKEIGFPILGLEDKGNKAAKKLHEIKNRASCSLSGCTNLSSNVDQPCACWSKLLENPVNTLVVLKTVFVFF